MIEVRLFATLRKNRGKIFYLDADVCQNGSQVLEHFSIPREEVAIFLINGFHSSPDSEIHDGAVLAIFPPVGGG